MTTDNNISHIINLLKSNKLDESLNEILNLKITSNPIYENFLINKFNKLGIKKNRLILEKDSSRDEL